tara:strand:+ start:1430 stop:2287 length:858 start_codon:yes stop_codon:yes gene_type:complete
MESKPSKARRSLLFVPGNRLNLLPKAIKARPDIICIDLEDSIPPEQKSRARTEVLEFFKTTSAHPKIELVMRINSLQTHEGIRDIDHIMTSSHPPLALMFTKLNHAAEIILLDKLLSSALLKKIRFHVIIETNSSLENVISIANASDRIDCLLFGGVDMAAELRTTFDWESLLYSRSRIVHAAASANIDSMDMPALNIENLEELETTAKAATKLGFTGKAAIHPSHIAIINQCFSPNPKAVEEARKVVAAYENSTNGLAVVDGKLLEKPFIRSMYRILALSKQGQ